MSRVLTEEGNASSVRLFTWDAAAPPPGSSSTSPCGEACRCCACVYGEAHRAVLPRWREWFLPVREAVTALWWVPGGHRPGASEGEDAVRRLRAEGPIPRRLRARRRRPAPSPA